MTIYKPSPTARIAHEDKNIQVYTDATWTPLAKGAWRIPRDAVVYANGTGDARVVSLQGRYKFSKAVAPDGTHYDVRSLA